MKSTSRVYSSNTTFSRMAPKRMAFQISGSDFLLHRTAVLAGGHFSKWMDIHAGALQLMRICRKTVIVFGVQLQQPVMSRHLVLLTTRAERAPSSGRCTWHSIRPRC